MRAVLQRVSSAAVTVDGTTVGSIGPGILALIGVEQGDAAADRDYLARQAPVRGPQDLLALIMEERTQRTVTRVLQNVATFVFIPL